MATVTRPPRTDAHRQRDALVQQFHDAGLTPVLSCNGSYPEADIQTMTDVSFDADGTMKAPTQPGQLVACWLTERGEARYKAAISANVKASLERAAAKIGAARG